jgi:hypothetical protein
MQARAFRNRDKRQAFAGFLTIPGWEERDADNVLQPCQKRR